MNRTLKRVLGLTGSVALGLAGAVAIGSAAQAHHVEVVGTAVCADDSWVVTWEVTDWDSKNVGPGVIDSVSANGELTGDIIKDAQLPHPSSGNKLVGTQTLSIDEPNATIEIDASWPNGETRPGGSWSVPQPEGGCETPAVPVPTVFVNAYSDCFGMEVYSTNDNPEALAEITYVPSVGEPVSYTPEAGEDFLEYFAVEDPEAGLSVTVLVDGEEYDTYQWDGGGNCEWGVIYDTCEGLEFELSIPEDGVETTYTLTPSEGEEVVVTLAPGETETVAFVATGDELTVSYLIEDDKNFYEGEVPWTKPEGCDEAPVESETPSAAPQLPTTGSSMTIMISAASALVLAAAVLFFIARRRRAAADW